MNVSIFYRRRAERFAQLLDEANGGPRNHARGRMDEQLRKLATVGHQVSTARPTVQLDGDFRVGLRAMLVATAEREGIGAWDPAGEPAPERTVGPVSHARTGGTTARRLRARGAVVVGVAVGAMAVSGISTASENAMPGDALYGVKRSTERAQLALAGSDVTRGQLFFQFARTRLAEAGQAPGGSPGLAAVFAEMDADTRQGVKLLTTSAVQHKDESALAAIDTFVTLQRRQISQVLPSLVGAGRDRALQSMTLLDDVDRRARALRGGLTCGVDNITRTDALGPQPGTCWSAPTTAPTVDGKVQREPAPQPGTRTADPVPTATSGPAHPAGPGRQRAIATPSATGASGAVGAVGANNRGPTGNTAPQSPSAAPADEPTEQPGPMSAAEDEDDGVLGDIGRGLGDILG